MLFHCKFQDHFNCPLCQTPDKKISHVIRCPGQGATDLALILLEAPLTATLKQLETDPLLLAAISALLTRWRKGIQMFPYKFPISTT